MTVMYYSNGSLDHVMSIRLWRLLPIAIFVYTIIAIFKALTTGDANEKLVQIIPSPAAMEEDEFENVTIVAATLFFGMKIPERGYLNECSVKDRCRLSDDHSLLNNADAVVFHNADFFGYKGPRHPRQFFVIWSIESPHNSPLRVPNNFINWTMTYRRDSDIWHPYAHIEKVDQVDVDFEAIWNEKTKSTAWLASNCQTVNNRRGLVMAMKAAGLNIDVYGKCGDTTTNDCDGVEKQSYDCVQQLIRPYKFYIAFENSNCLEYVTEKFFETLRSRRAIPIVMERATYMAIKAPNDSYIAASDYPNVASLVKALQRIESNKVEYLKYHQWRRNYAVHYEPQEDTGFCALCHKLLKGRNRQKTYANIYQWHVNLKCDHKFTGNFLAQH